MTQTGIIDLTYTISGTLTSQDTNERVLTEDIAYDSVSKHQRSIEVDDGEIVLIGNDSPLGAAVDDILIHVYAGTLQYRFGEHDSWVSIIAGGVLMINGIDIEYLGVRKKSDETDPETTDFSVILGEKT